MRAFVESTGLLLVVGSLTVITSLTLQAQLQDQQPASRPPFAAEFRQGSYQPPHIPEMAQRGCRVYHYRSGAC